MRIGIDPGHGGKDPGAIGQEGLRESDVNLAVALHLEKMLKINGFDTVLTREKDIYLKLSQRSDILNTEKSSVAISIHVNSSRNPSAKYVSTFIHARGGKAEALAKIVQSQLVAVTGWQDGGVRVANFHITRETKMPAILLEQGFIKNYQHEKWLRSLDNQKKLAEAVARGVCQFYGKPYQEMEENRYSLIGKKIEDDAEIEFEGKKISGGIIEGTAVVGVRALAEMLGLKVDYDPVAKKVTLKRF
ncbi:MAG: N-acetylmuramoyl-L-alanine amidase [Desulfitobacteriaceae bacterium]|nr:N-acetylmuramoyl-L-alanine amidase [Desulfitobacteriaceae bacterium]MDD4751768.1 N-acetylmuramoyl-L-alanine amidase [Desulfitobacteriaceae bacterium]